MPEELSALNVYAKGTKAWFPDEEEGWVLGALETKEVTDDHVKLAFKIPNKGTEVIFESNLAKLIEGNFSELPPLKNPPMLEGIDDLAQLSYLHEPAVLHNIRLRYGQEQIYTYSGIVLIAMNPFARLSIYTPDMMRQYSGKRRGDLEPHLFAVAEEAYRAMIREKKNQSIIVSGESGAGKTQSAKYIMRYFATVDNLDDSTPYSRPSAVEAGNAASKGGSSEIEDAVLSTNPIMESFGNSKTTRNDNSSRFGKYIEILFSKPQGPSESVTIIGAKIRTYLLERSRLIFQPPTGQSVKSNDLSLERNYHIFYQICAGAPAAEKKELGLTSWDHFFYLNQGGQGTVAGMDDALEFQATQKALSTVGISVSSQWEIFKICAALLHIGNMKVIAVRDEAHIDDDDPSLVLSSKLLGLDKSEFKKWIVKKQIITRSEKIVTALNQHQAITGRDSVAKFIYSMLFDWLVKVINKNLAKEGDNVGTFIGVLDIYGFEHFKKNSFEQFCINYANEKLQQEFNQHVFKLEQDEYVAEQINWSFISFNDNQPCIDMIENKLGILDFLDEESRLPSGSDSSLITKLYQRLAVPTQKFFEKPRFGQKAFTIKHYACDVVYDIDGFIEKNKDTVSDEQLALLNGSQFGFLQEVVRIEVPETPVEDPAPGRRGGALKKPTLGSIFKLSLVSLMETIRKTQVHYIRCIKPNQAKKAFMFEPQMVLQQLRACGVLETIRISCAGYPSRWTYAEFVERYYVLTRSQHWEKDAKELTDTIIKKNISDADKYQIGLTKIFFRAGQLAFLEKLRTDRINYCVVLIQASLRKIIYRKKFIQMRQAAIKIQSRFRAYTARKKYLGDRATRAAIKIQKHIRAWLCRRKYQRIRKVIVRLQSLARSRAAKRLATGLRRERAAVVIQKNFRMHVVQKQYKLARRRIVLIQSCVRRKRAMKELKALKVEAKSVGKLKEMNFSLENKVVELSQALQSKDQEKKALAEKIHGLESQSQHWKDKCHEAEAKLKAISGQNLGDTTALKKELHEVQAAKEALVKDQEKLISAIKKKDDDLSNVEEELTKAREEIKKLKEELKAPKVAEESGTVNALKKEVTSLRDQLGKLLSGKWRADSESTTNETSLYGNAVSASGRYTPDGPTRTPVSLAADGGGLARKPTLSKQISIETQEPNRQRTLSNANRPPPAYLSDSSPASPMSSEPYSADPDRPHLAVEERVVEEEIVESLITHLRIPLPSTQTVAIKKEIFFPAHLIGSVIVQMLHGGTVAKMQLLMNNVMKAIQTLTMKFEDDYVSAFWLSNCFELLCVVKTTLDKESHSRHVDSSDIDRALEKIKDDLDYLLVEIYHGWIKELKKRLGNMIVPAVIENQSLPGYICKQSGGLWGKWGKTTTSSQFSIEQLLNFLSKLSKTMRCYYMEDNMTRQILTELLRVIGVSSFNHLLMRKNFCTWKRGVQIQYNVSRLEEWCTSHGIAEATLHLQQLLQAAKLLTLNKTSPQDIETIFDVCFLLNPTQIKKIMSLYYAADFDSPLSPELLKIVSNRAILNERSDNLLLDLEQTPDFSKPAMRHVDIVEKFIPGWISLPHVAALLQRSH